MSRYSVMLISFLLIASSCHGMEPTMDEDTGLLAERKILMDALNARDFITAQAVVDQKSAVVNAYKRCREYSLEYSGDLLTPLHECVVQDDRSAVEWLLKAGAQSNALTKMRDYAPLHCAQSVQMVKLLVAYGADVHSKNYMEQTPLATALGDRQYDVAHCLVKKCGARVNEPIDSSGNTLLGKMVGREKTKHVVFLLRHGADPEQCNTVGETPFGKAIEAKPECRKIINILEQHNTGTVLNFKSSLTDFNEHGNTALHSAALLQRLGDIRELMDHNINLSQRNSAGKTAFDLLRESGNKECIDLFMDLFTQKFLNSHLYTAEYKNCKQCIRSGLDVNVPLDTFGSTLLARAVIKGCHRRCALLLAHKAQVNVEDRMVGSPLMLAVAFRIKDIDIIKLLLQHGALVTPRMLNIVRCNYVRAMLQEAYAKQIV